MLLEHCILNRGVVCSLAGVEMSIATSTSGSTVVDEVGIAIVIAIMAESPDKTVCPVRD